MFIHFKYPNFISHSLLSVLCHPFAQFNTGLSYIKLITVLTNESIYYIFCVTVHIMLHCKSFPISKCKRLTLIDDWACFDPTLPTFFTHALLSEKSNFEDDRIRFKFLGCRLLFMIGFLSRTFFILSLLRNCSQALTTGKMFVFRGLKVVTHGITFSLPSYLRLSPFIGLFSFARKMPLCISSSG